MVMNIGKFSPHIIIIILTIKINGKTRRFDREALLGVLGIRDTWKNNFRDKG